MEQTSTHSSPDTSPHSPSHGSPGLRVYYLVYAALMVLLFLTVLVARFDWGQWNLTVAMLIAATKAAMVALYFMHLRYSSRLTWLFAGAGLAWLFILFLITLADYLSRAWVGS